MGRLSLCSSLCRVVDILLRTLFSDSFLSLSLSFSLMDLYSDPRIYSLAQGPEKGWGGAIFGCK